METIKGGRDKRKKTAFQKEKAKPGPISPGRSRRETKSPPTFSRPIQGGHKAYLLVVDDKEEDKALLKSLLEKQGYVVDTAQNGAEALLKARKSAPELIISDLLMPVMDGFNLLSRWRKDKRLHKIPFIVYSASYGGQEEENLVLGWGADGFIAKPAAFESFMGRLAEIEAKTRNPSTIRAKPPASGDENPLILYSETLIRKLEEKTILLEASNRALEDDIAERKKTEEALLESAQCQRRLAERLAAAQLIGNVGSWETDLETMNVIWSENLHRIFGTDPETFRPTHSGFLEKVHPQDREALDLAFQRSLSEEGPHSIVHRIRLPDGSEKIVEERWNTFRNEQGRPVRAIGTCQDITEKKNLETRFLRAQRMESIGTLAGGIAHDLNNILTPILMAIQILKSRTSDKESLSLLSTLQGCAQRGGELVKQVLGFARGIDGQRIDVNLLSLGMELEKIIEETFPKTIRFSTELEPHLLPVTGDPTQLHQVLVNLCVNARDAMPLGGSLTLRMKNVVLDEVYASMNPDSKAGPYVLIEVADSGTGIPSEIREKIFEPFFTTKELGDGTGLGLSTTSAIVSSHGGFIKVHSAKDVGSRFHVFLPAQASPVPEGVEGKSPAIPKSAGETILIVDDESSIRDIMRQTLEYYGYKVILAKNGVEAVALYVQNMSLIDLVITDMTMPLMDGFMTISALKAINSSVRIVASSGLENSNNLAKAREAGIQHFIPKPYTSEALLEAVQQSLAIKSS